VRGSFIELSWSGQDAQAPGQQRAPFLAKRRDRHLAPASGEAISLGEVTGRILPRVA
jgi:hypothetical protein